MGVTTENYFETLSAVRDEIARRLTEARVELGEPDFFSDSFKSFSSGVKYGQTVRESAPIQTYKGKSTNKYAHAIVTRFEPGYLARATYELTFYIL